MWENFSSSDIPGQPFRDAVLKAMWAKSKVRHFESVCQDFLDENGPSIERCRDNDRPETHEIIRVIMRTSLPDAIPLLFGDILHNARASLDYLACALVRANGHEPTRFTQFPFGADEESVRNLANGKLANVSDEARDAILGCKPYPWGNDLLYAVHDLNRTDKHTRLTTSVIHLAGLSGHFSVSEEVTAAKTLSGNLKKGIPLLSIPKTTDFQPKLEVHFGITVERSGPVNSQPVGTLAREICKITEIIVLYFAENFG